MSVFLLYTVLIGYIICIYIVGSTVVRRFFSFYNDPIYRIISAVLVGLLLVVPITYLASCLFAYTHEGIFWGIISTTAVIFFVHSVLFLSNRKKKAKQRSTTSFGDLIVPVFSLVVGFWLMAKSLHSGSDGTWYVSSNTVFDTAHILAVIRSFSWGNNLPFASPFANGIQESYHFFFYFLVACFERFGVPLVAALTALSAMGFSLYLIMSYYFGFFLFGKKKIVGWLTVLLLLFHSTMTWWFVFFQNFQGVKELWHLAKYPFAGPYDGSPISLFFTLNVFVNQRHLSIGLAFGLWLFLTSIFALKTKKFKEITITILGMLIGLSILWNIMLSFAILLSVVLLYVFEKKWKASFLTCLGFILVGIIPLFPYIQNLWQMLEMQTTIAANAYGTQSIAIGGQIQYWWLNLGVAPFVFIFGWITMKKEEQKKVLPIVILFIFIMIGTALGSNTIFQKILNYWNIAFVAIVSGGIAWLWQRKGIARVIVIPILFTLTASGIIDLMVIKNDFAYPAITPAGNQFINLLHHRLPEDAVVLSYKEMFQNVSLAGRKQYYGFFASPQADYRLAMVTQIFESKTKETVLANLQGKHITHILLPKQRVSDFTYSINYDLYRSIFLTTYEDDQYILFDVGNRVIQ